MEKEELYRYVDHTALKAFTTWKNIEKLCEEAIKYHTASVCIPSCYISRVKETYGDKIKICTVVGFPLDMRTLKESWQRQRKHWKTAQTKLIW